MWVFMYAYMYTYISNMCVCNVCVYASMHSYQYYVYACTYIHMHPDLCMLVHTHIYACMYASIFTSICISVICLCIYVQVRPGLTDFHGEWIIPSVELNCGVKCNLHMYNM